MKVEIEIDDVLRGRLDSLSERDRRSLEEYIVFVLDVHCFGIVGRNYVPMSDEELAAATEGRNRKAARVTIKASTRQQIFSRDGGVCVHCSGKIHANELWHVDHLVPLSKGGSNEIDNLALSCVRCNLEKHNKLMDAYNARAGQC